MREGAGTVPACFTIRRRQCVCVYTAAVNGVGWRSVAAAAGRKMAAWAITLQTNLRRRILSAPVRTRAGIPAWHLQHRYIAIGQNNIDKTLTVMTVYEYKKPFIHPKIP